MLWRVVAPHFVAGLIEDDQDAVSHAAPILRWTIGRPILDVRCTQRLDDAMLMLGVLNAFDRDMHRDFKASCGTF